MKKSNRITSLIISAMMSISAMPIISNAENTNLTLPYEKPDLEEPILEDALPCYINGNTAVFKGDKNYDFVTSVAPYSEFKTERKDETFEFTPENDGSFIVSRVWLEEMIISYDIEVDYSAEAGSGTMVDIIETHCHYFYPHIQNFKITYDSETGTRIDYLGERSFYNENTVNEIKSNNSVVCFDRMEMNTDDIFNGGSYYALASCNLGADMFFTYFDYGYEYTKKDKSVFCIKGGYYGEYYESGDYQAIRVTGNAEKTNTFYDGSYIDGNLMVATADMIAYTIIEPTGDGLAEVDYDPNYNSPYDLYIPTVDLYIPVVPLILTIENGQFLTSVWQMDCELPDIGDLNMDGKIGISDAVVFQKYMIGSTKLTNIQTNCADMNSDGSVDVFDMVLIRQKVIEDNHLGLIPEPVDTIKNHDSY
ncbi:MAG: dockerin type I repeat-containing protein [Ruminococcus sp.]|nr:dockerin type I repeat-containing protein [Ruminococcus sp.]